MLQAQRISFSRFGRRLAPILVVTLAACGIGCSGTTHSESTSNATNNAQESSKASSCDEWIAYSDEERYKVIGAALERQIGGPATSPLSGCLWVISEQIAEQSVEICQRDGGEFGHAIGLALESAVGYCEKS